MKFDAYSFVELIASAAVLVTVLAAAWGENRRIRLRLAAAAAGWFGVVTVLGVTGALGARQRFGTPALGLVVMLPLVLLAVVAKRLPALRRGLDAVPLAALIGVNALRVLGVNFVLLYAAGRLPAPFAPSAGWGDILIGVTAIPLAWLAGRAGGAPRPLVLAWAVAGLTDLVVAVGLGVTSSPGPLQLIHAAPGTGIMTTLPWLWIPGFLVPLFAATHLAIFYRLAGARGRSAESLPAAPLAWGNRP